MKLPVVVVRSVFALVFVLVGIFSTHAVASAAFGGSMYPDGYIYPGGSHGFHTPMSGGVYPYTCTITGTDGTNRPFSRVNPQDGFDVKQFFSPSQTTDYTLKCTDAAGAKIQSSAKITVGTPLILTFKASPSSLPAGGGKVQIDTDVKLVTSCKPTDGTAEWRAMTGLQGDGQYGQTTPPISLTQTTTFSLECFNDAGLSTGKKSVQVYVGLPCGNEVIDPGEQCDAGLNNDDTCVKSDCSKTCQWVGGQICDLVGNEPVCGNGIVEPKWDHGVNQGETCDDGAGNGNCPALCAKTSEEGTGGCRPNSCTNGMTVHLDAGDDGSEGEYPYHATNTKIKLGKSIAIEYTVTNAVSCSTSGFSPGNLAPSASGRYQLTPSEEGKYTVSITCTDKYGQTLTREDSFSVGADVDAEILTFTATPQFVPFTSDGQVQFEWTGTDLGTCAIAGAAPPQVTDDNYGSATITYTDNQRKQSQVEVDLDCHKGTDKESREIMVYFESDPSKAPVVDFRINNNSHPSMTATAGATLTLSWMVSGATRCQSTNFMEKGSNEIVPPAPGVKPTAKVTFTAPTTYSLECWNAPEYGSLSTKKSIEVTFAVDGGGEGQGGGGGPGHGGDGTCQSPNTCLSGGCPPETHTPGPGTCSDTGASCCTLKPLPSPGIGYFNPLKYNSVDSVLSAVLSTLQGIIVTLSIIMIIVGAVMYILSAGNESRVTQAKVAITASMVGLALAIAAPAFLKEIGELLGWIEVTQVVEEAQSFTQIATKVLNFLLSIVGIIAIIMLVIGGLMYLTAGGDEGKAETGKKITTYAIIAIAIALAALVLVTQVAGFFG